MMLPGHRSAEQSDHAGRACHPEANSGVEIKNVYVGIAGQHIKSLQHRGILVRDSLETEISKEDIKKLTDDMRKLVVSPGDKIIHVLPQEFMVDSEMTTSGPVGMCGIRLEANFHIITGQISAAQNIKKCVEKAGLHMIDMILEPLASAAAVLSEEEKEAGVALVDIGGGTTDIAIFQDGIIRHTYVIPFGGNVITEDIKEGCLVMRNQAEILKCRFGSALSDASMDNQIVSIPGVRGRDAKEISVRNLANVINARMEEILEHVDSEINISGFKSKLIAGRACHPEADDEDWFYFFPEGLHFGNWVIGLLGHWSLVIRPLLFTLNLCSCTLYVLRLTSYISRFTSHVSRLTI